MAFLQLGTYVDGVDSQIFEHAGEQDDRVSKPHPRESTKKCHYQEGNCEEGLGGGIERKKGKIPGLVWARKHRDIAGTWGQWERGMKRSLVAIIGNF